MMALADSTPQGFLRNSLKLFSGNFTAQIIIVCAIPIITRIYPPELFGIFALFVTLSQIFASFSHLRYANAILKPKEESAAASTVWLALSVSFFSTFCLWMIIKLLPDLLLLGAWRVIHQNTTLLFASSYLGSMVLTLNFWLIRKNSFSCLGIARVVEAFTSRTAIIALGIFYKVSSLGLILSFAFGQLASCLTMSSFALHREWHLIKNAFKIENMKIQAIRFRSFALYSPSILCNSTRREFPVLAMAFFFEPVTVGHYALCQRIIGQPLGIMGDALSRSFFQKAAELHHRDEKVGC